MDVQVPVTASHLSSLSSLISEGVYGSSTNLPALLSGTDLTSDLIVLTTDLSTNLTALTAELAPIKQCMMSPTSTACTGCGQTTLIIITKFSSDTYGTSSNLPAILTGYYMKSPGNRSPLHGIEIEVKGLPLNVLLKFAERFPLV